MKKVWIWRFWQEELQTLFFCYHCQIPKINIQLCFASILCNEVHSFCKCCSQFSDLGTVNNTMLNTDVVVSSNSFGAWKILQGLQILLSCTPQGAGYHEQMARTIQNPSGRPFLFILPGCELSSL